MANPTKKTLSKNLTQMKFMQRASQTLNEEQTDGSGGLIEKWVAPNVPPPPEKGQRVKVIECSFVECEELNCFGRFSYNKFNKEVERLSRLQSKHEEATSEHTGHTDEEEGTIPPHEMAKRYEEITSRKFLGKRSRSAVITETEGMVSDVVIDKDGFMKPT